MRKFYVVFKSGKVFVVFAKYFTLLIQTPFIGDPPISKSIQMYAFYDELSSQIAQFFYEDILCITNEDPDLARR